MSFGDLTVTGEADSISQKLGIGSGRSGNGPMPDRLNSHIVRGQLSCVRSSELEQGAYRFVVAALPPVQLCFWRRASDHWIEIAIQQATGAPTNNSTRAWLKRIHCA